MRRWPTGIATGLAVAAAAAVGVVAALATASAASPATTQAAPIAPVNPILPILPPGPSPLIYPAETIPIRFDHAAHARLGATCESCHNTAAQSTAAADNLIPG